ncbi:MAG: metallophosphoesterase [Phycisphaerae bacterium]
MSEESTNLTPDEAEITPPPRGPRPRRVLLGALLFAGVGVGLWALSPWILPVYIAEGPLVQQADATSAAVVWFTSRAAQCELRYTLASGEQVAPAESSGRRNIARMKDLPAGVEVTYRITAGDATLVNATLRTNKPPGSAFSFIVFGDSGRGTTEQYRLARDMYAARPDFVLHTGDLVYPGGERYHYNARFFRPYEALLAEVAFWPSLGNHDVGEPSFGAAYLDVFELPRNGPSTQPPEQNYWFDYASARVAVIDSNLAEAELSSQIAPWLQTVMSAPGPSWRFVVFHHPPYTVGSHAPDVEIERAIVPVLEETNVDMVFCGHDHTFQRTLPMRGGQIAEDGHGVVYVVSGAGGAKLYELQPREKWPAYMAAANSRIHSFTHVSINGRTLRLKQIALGGAVIDDWPLERR